MGKSRAHAPIEAPVDIASIEAALQGLEMEDIGEEIIGDEEQFTDESVDVAAEIDDLDLSDMAAIETEIERQASYAAQTSEIDASANTAPAAKAVKTKKEKTVKTTGAAPSPRVERDLASISAEFFVLDKNDTDVDSFEAIKTSTLGAMPTQKKVAEKFENLFSRISVGSKPSSYVCDIFPLLTSKGMITSADIVAAFIARGLGMGTAQSQSGQIMSLFPAVGLATRANNVLTRNPDSKIAERLSVILA
ncbi:MAG: hypothetical protein ACEQSB_00640 [Undibacterium sp.]